MSKIMLRGTASLAIMVGVLALLTLAWGAPAWASTTHTVTNTNDSGSGSLRQAISDANAGDTINFSLPPRSTIALDKRLDIEKPLIIQGGPGVDDIIIKGNQGVSGERTIFVDKHEVVIQDLTIIGGANENGGGVYNQGSLHLVNVAVTGGNHINMGGGIYNNKDATLELRDSTVSGNRALLGGGIYNNEGTLQVWNSTVSGNTAYLASAAEEGDGGGIYNTGLLVIDNSTISANTAEAAGGGVYNVADAVATLSYVTLLNNVSSFGANFTSAEEIDQWTTRKPEATLEGVLTVSTASAGPNCYAEHANDQAAPTSSFMTSQGYNMGYENTGNTNSCNLDQATDIPNTDPQLGALADNGGPTKTHALPTSSPAVDAIPVAPICIPDDGNSCLPPPLCPAEGGVPDQRDLFDRPQDGNGDGSALCDIGAFELGTAADLSIDLEAPQSAQIGVPFDYTITVTNNGPTDAVDTLVRDDLPDGVTYNDVTTDFSSILCDVPSPELEPGQFLCEVGHMNPGEVRKLTINVTPTQEGTLANQAEVVSDTFDPNGDNNGSVVRNTAVTIGATADLSVVAEAGNPTVDVGKNLQYAMTVRNDGPDPATGVKVTNKLPPNTTFVEASNGCTYSAGTVTCSYDAGDKTVYPHDGGPTFYVTIEPDLAAAGTTLSTTATVSGHVYDPNKANNSSTITPNVNPAADLSINKTGPATANVEEQVTYTLTATNEGPNQASGVWVYDTLPATAAFVSATPSAGGGCDNTPAEGASGEVSCYFNTVDKDASATVEVVAEPKLPAAGTTLTNSATVSSVGTFDPDKSNNQTTADTAVATAADLSIEVDAPEAVDAGQQLVYTLTATNGGPSTANDVTVTDELPENVTFLSATTPTGGDCETPQVGAAGTVNCTFDTLGEGENAEFEIAVEPTPTAQNTTLTNTATVSSTGAFDPDETNNSASATVRVLDITPPHVETTRPANGARGVSRSANVTATFSEKMDPATISKSTFKLYRVNPDKTTTQITNVTVALGANGLKAKVDPFGTSTKLLPADTKYRAIVTTGAKDLAGNRLAKNYVWTFTTGSR